MTWEVMYRTLARSEQSTTKGTEFSLEKRISLETIKKWRRNRKWWCKEAPYWNLLKDFSAWLMMPEKLILDYHSLWMMCSRFSFNRFWKYNRWCDELSKSVEWEPRAFHALTNYELNMPSPKVFEALLFIQWASRDPKKKRKIWWYYSLWGSFT